MVTQFENRNDIDTSTIVMLGNSLTEFGGDWSEKLGRPGIVNYGIIMLMRMQNPELFPSPGEVVADTEAYYKLHLSDMKRAYLDAFAGVKALMEQDLRGEMTAP